MFKNKRRTMMAALLMVILLGGMTGFAAQNIVGTFEPFDFSFDASDNTPQFSGDYSTMREGDLAADVNISYLAGDFSNIRLQLVVVAYGAYAPYRAISAVFIPNLGSQVIETDPYFQNTTGIFQVKATANYSDAYTGGTWRP